MPPETNLKLPTRRYALGLGVAWEAHKFFKWTFAVFIVLALLVPLVVSQYRTIDVSAWSFAAYSGKIFTAIVAGSFLYTLFPIFLAQGLIRREFSTAMGLFGLVWSLILGVIAIGGFVAEHAWYGLFDWRQAVQQDANDLVIDSVGAALAYSASFPLTYLLFFAGGALIGAASYRWSGGWLVVAPIAPLVFSLDFALTRSEPWGPDWLRMLTGFAGEATALAAAGAIAVVIAVFAWIGRAILLETPVHAKKA